MKKLLLGFLLLSTISFANTVIVTLPYNTEKIISSDYSTGGGDKSIVYLEVLVKLKDGRCVMYIDECLSVSGIFGIGRFTIPNKFEYIIDDTGTIKDDIIVKW